MLDTSLVAMPFFLLGIEIRRHGALRPHPYDRLGLPLFVLVLAMLWFTAEPLNMFDQIYPAYFKTYALTFAAILAFFMFAKSLPRIPVITYMGRFSLILLCTQNILLNPLRAIVYGTAGTSYWCNWIVLALFVGVHYLIIPLFVRVIPWFVAQKPLIKGKDADNNNRP